MPRKAKGAGRVVGGIVNQPLLGTVERLHEMGYTDTEIVRQGIRLLGKREKVCA